MIFFQENGQNTEIYEHREALFQSFLYLLLQCR